MLIKTIKIKNSWEIFVEFSESGTSEDGGGAAAPPPDF